MTDRQSLTDLERGVPFAERHNLRALEAAYRYCTIRSRSLR